jgi:hypothetical protein
MKTQTVRAHWFEDWHADLDAALEALPEAENCPRGMYRELMENRTELPGRTVLVTEGDEPIAVAGLRLRGRLWEPATNWIVPGMVFPMREGAFLKAAAAIHKPMQIAWWRMGQPPMSRRNHGMTREVTYGTDLNVDLEAMWRELGLWRAIRQGRSRAKGFEFQVNAPGSAEWVIRKWNRHWGGNRTEESGDLRNRLLVARELEKCGEHFTCTLREGDRILAGNTVVKHGDAIVGQTVYRDEEYEWHAVGVRLLELTFFWAKENGIAHFDIGGGHDYKKRWAPVGGEWHSFEHLPTASHYMRLLRRAPSGIRSGIRTMVHGLTTVGHIIAGW